MNKLIKILDDKTVSQIAAGEVIEAPCAVVKELTENSLDAGASSITIAVEKGGKELVRVSDNGIGMSADDLKIAFKRHSTSKIRSADDLVSVATLGFRGEALAAIASVSQIEALAKMTGETEGYRILIQEGEQIEFAPAGCAEGTEVTVRNLFFNTPVRMKFLKSDSKEADKCFRMFKGMALSNPNVEWKYFQDGRMRTRLPLGTLRERIADLMNIGFLEGLAEVDYREGAMNLTGFIGDKSHTRRSREQQFFFLNGRLINLGKFNYIFKDIYSGPMDSGEYPVYILFLTMETGEVDVNVHPTKSEVRFRHQGWVGGFLHRALTKALGTEDLMKPVPHSFRKNGEYSERSPTQEKKLPITPAEYGLMFEKDSAHTAAGPGGADIPHSENAEERLVPRALFQLHRKYIVAQVKTGLVLIDQHAAHERILYEQALKTLVSGNAPSQKLIFSRGFDLAMGEEESFEELLPNLRKMGFDVNQLGPRSYQIEAAPAGLKVSDEIRLVRDIFDYYRETGEKWSDAAEKAAAAFACKAAIKSGDELTPQEMVALIEALHRTGMPFACPHGRPTYIQLKMEEFDRRFGRT
ncbi:MAG: DNA mismatch repair endonuclease MutL [candidate division Zixibacteria bacterium]|nr:DNA mismatch repair endonuclease MutL [Candidatus Tariuqbacter arcticus]